MSGIIEVNLSHDLTQILMSNYLSLIILSISDINSDTVRISGFKIRLILGYFFNTLMYF